MERTGPRSGWYTFRFLLPSGFVIMLRFKMFAGKASFYDESQNPNSFYLSGNYNLSAIGTYNEIKIVAIDWRGLRTESDPFVINVTSPENLPVLTSVPFCFFVSCIGTTGEYSGVWRP